MERVKQREERSIEGDIPTAPTMEDFYYDPGIREEQTRSQRDPLDSVASFGQIGDNSNRLCLTGKDKDISSRAQRFYLLYCQSLQRHLLIRLR